MKKPKRVICSTEQVLSNNVGKQIRSGYSTQTATHCTFSVLVYPILKKKKITGVSIRNLHQQHCIGYE